MPHSALRTPLCDLLGIRYPILCAGMGLAAGPELAAAVSEAGGFGVIGGGGGTPPGPLSERVVQARALTKSPFGVNVIIDQTEPGDDVWLRDQIAAICEMDVAALVLFWGDPAPHVKTARDHGVKVLIQVGSTEEAEAAAAAGVDAVIAQGVEAGGHVRGTTSIWELLPETVRALNPLPVLASGGIGDAAGVVRAVQLGAQGVSLGTRFVASDEFQAHPAYKQRIVDGRAEETVYNLLYDVWWPNAPHRTLRNKTIDEWEAAGRPPSGSRPGEGTPIGHYTTSTGERIDWPRYAIGVAGPDFDGDIEYAPLWAGTSVSLVNDIKPAAEIIRNIVREAEAALNS